MAYLDCVCLRLLRGSPHLHTNNTNTVKAALKNRIYVFTYVHLCRTVSVKWVQFSVAGILVHWASERHKTL